MKPVLPDSLVSIEQFEAATLGLRQYSAALRQTAAQATRGVQAQSPAADGLTAELVAQLPAASQADPAAIEQLAADLDAMKRGLPIIRVVLPSMPSGQYKAKLVAWFRQNVHPQLLISFVRDGTIGGGAVLRVGSKMYDWSFGTRVADNRRKIAEKFRAG